jgi:AcrR family transcriptional regulator
MTAGRNGASPNGAVATGRWPARDPRPWDQPNFRMFGGPHGLPPELVLRIQRDRLLDAMISVGAEVGYHDACVAKVIAAAGVSRRTFYDLFRSKDECFLAAYEDVASCLLAFVAKARADGRAPYERIQRTVGAFFEFWAEEPDAASTCVVEVLAAGHAARARRARTMDWLTGLIEDDLRELQGDDALVPVAARAFMGGVHELTYTWIERGETERLPDLTEQVMASQVMASQVMAVHADA